MAAGLAEVLLGIVVGMAGALSGNPTIVNGGWVLIVAGNTWLVGFFIVTALSETAPRVTPMMELCDWKLGDALQCNRPPEHTIRWSCGCQQRLCTPHSVQQKRNASSPSTPVVCRVHGRKVTLLETGGQR